ncbi:Bax inhibitor-1/YccA family protein [Capnocytophaga canimorsus]|uniref:Bax inhibitor-1/YccA family protein n=1 Tax=Capnocytophaga canimorsus TaxID=28188 RepID=UPI0037D7FF66
MFKFEKSGNPVLKEETFRKSALINEGVMTFKGALNKTALLLLLTIAAAYFTWTRSLDVLTAETMKLYVIGGAIGGFIVSLIIIFRSKTAPYLAPAYAILEGFFLGGISAMFEMQYPGIAFQAIAATFSVFLALLLVYRTGIIKVTQKFRMIVVGATAGIALFYLLGFVLSFFSVQMPLIHDSSIFGIGFSVVVVIIASLNLVLDFDFIEKASNGGAPKYMEWYAGFSLMITLVWLYIEILRLLSKLRD